MHFSNGYRSSIFNSRLCGRPWRHLGERLVVLFKSPEHALLQAEHNRIFSHKSQPEQTWPRAFCGHQSFMDSPRPVQSWQMRETSKAAFAASSISYCCSWRDNWGKPGVTSGPSRSSTSSSQITLSKVQRIEGRPRGISAGLELLLGYLASKNCSGRSSGRSFTLWKVFNNKSIFIGVLRISEPIHQPSRKRAGSVLVSHSPQLSDAARCLWYGLSHGKLDFCR